MAEMMTNNDDIDDNDGHGDNNDDNNWWMTAKDLQADDYIMKATFSCAAKTKNQKQGMAVLR